MLSVILDWSALAVLVVWLPVGYGYRRGAHLFRRQDALAMSELTAQLDLPLGVDAPAAARHAIMAVLGGWGFRDERWLAAAAVVVSELVTNAVRHGGGAVAFTVESHDEQVVLCVADGSSVVPRHRDPDDVGGRGLAVIEALSTGWGVRDHQGGKQVWVRLKPYPGPLPTHPGTGREGAA